VQKHKLEASQTPDIGKILQIILGQVKFDQIDAQAQSIDFESERSVQDKQFQAIMLRHKFLKRYNSAILIIRVNYIHQINNNKTVIT
jgi:hypothetical protein